MLYVRGKVKPPLALVTPLQPVVVFPTLIAGNLVVNPQEATGLNRAFKLVGVCVLVVTVLLLV